MNRDVDSGSKSLGASAAAAAAPFALPSFEVLPAQVERLAPQLARCLPGTEIYLPLLPGTHLLDAIAPAGRLLEMGLVPVPHVTARRTKDRASLSQHIEKLLGAGVTRLLLLAGDGSKPEGDFISTLDFINSGVIEGSGVKQVRFAGHPQGHTAVADDVLYAAVAAKQEWAAKTGMQVSLVTQFVFDAAPVIAWQQRLRERGVTLPVRVGIPGPAKITTLIKYALQCGVATSAAALARNPGMVMVLGQWNAEQVVEDLRRHIQQDEHSLIDNLHVYPFGGMSGALNWLGL